MVKLLLSLSNNTYAFALRECFAGMDDSGVAVALRVVSYYARLGIEYDTDLQMIAQTLAKRYTRLSEVAEAWVKVRLDLIEKWRLEDGADVDGT